MQLVLNTHGLALKVRDKAFFVSNGKEHRKISPEQITSIAVTSPCVLSSAAIMLAADAGIPIYFFDRVGDARSALRSPWFESVATLRRKQVYFSDMAMAGQWVIEQFQRKTAEQVKVLQYLLRKTKSNRERIAQAISKMELGVEQLFIEPEPPSLKWSAKMMGWEGRQAKTYWRIIGESLPTPWQFDKRSRRPAQDAFNALINYGYGILYGKTEQALFAAGLDPHLGILHADEYDSPTLSYDLIECFRPMLDRLVIEKILTDEASLDDFDHTPGGCFLNENGKRWFIPAVNQWLIQKTRWQQKQLSREGHIFHQAGLLAKTIKQTAQRPNS